MKFKPGIPFLTDTSPDAAAVQVRLLRGMSASRKVDLVENANRTTRCLALAGIGPRFPEASAAERNRILMDLLLRKELAERVYGPLPKMSGR